MSTSLALPVQGGGKPRPVSFLTTSDRTLARGQLSVEAPVRAEEQGARGVVDAGAVGVLDQTVLGISGVANDAPTVFGAAGESDDELRRRAKTVAERAGRATPRALTNALAGVAGLRENDIKVVEQLTLRPGVVEVFVAADPTESLAVAVEQSILDTRAAGIRVEHNLAAFLPALTLAPAAVGELREADVIVSDEPVGEDFRYPLTATVIVYPEDPRVQGAAKDAIQAAVLDAVASYVEASAIGDTLVYNRISADIMAVPGVYDAVLDIGGKRNVVVPEGRRAVIDRGTGITVAFAGAPLSFDFQLQVTLTGGDLAAVRSEARARLTTYFASPLTTVDSASITAVLQPSELYTLDALAWTAEYEQAGLVIREPGGPSAATAVAEGIRPLLRDVAVGP